MIDYGLLSSLTGRVDRNRNNRIDPGEGRMSGRVGNDNGVAGTREAANAIAAGDAVLRDFRLGASDAELTAREFARGDAWVSRDDIFISQRARDRIDGMGGGAVDGRISARELATALEGGSLALARDGLYLSIENSDRPTPPPVDRPTPPPVGRPTPPPLGRPTTPPVDRPTSPPVDRPTPPPVGRPTPPPVGRPTTPPVDRPTPPPVGPAPIREPRYYWQPTFPIILPTRREPLPQIGLPTAPAPARKVDPAEVTADPFQLLYDAGRLRKQAKFLWVFTYYPKIGPGEARTLLQAGMPIFVSEHDGFFGGSRQRVTSAAQLDNYSAAERERKYRALQDAEIRAYQGRLASWRETDIQNRVANLPPFNAIYDMDRLNLNNLIVSEGGRQFNRNLITAMNVYNRPETRREIAARWHERPDITTAEFNRMASSVITSKVSALFWDARHQGDWGTHLGTNPVPGLRYPDTQEDVDYNANVIQRVSVEVPLLLGSAVLA